jgi:hypothetical protein
MNIMQPRRLYNRTQYVLKKLANIIAQKPPPKQKVSTQIKRNFSSTSLRPIILTNQDPLPPPFIKYLLYGALLYGTYKFVVKAVDTPPPKKGPTLW